MKVEKFFPSPALKPFIKAYLIVESEQEADSKTIPDTAIVMAFRYAGNVLRKEDGQLENIPATAISGLRKSARLFNYQRQTGNLLVILNEGGIAAFSGLPAHELFGLSISSDNLFPVASLREILERLAEAKSHRHRVGVMETFLLKHLAVRKADPLIGEAIQRIQAQNGLARIKDLAASLHISQDPFEKRFRHLIGASPKQYASIIRLRNVISRYPHSPSLTAASYDAGYFDQSHFIKDFRLFTGQSPKDFFKSEPFW
ncbi:AraC family transcriptional regulator [Chitinophaga lutea]|uniref:AraC family transcriptional regulator n=1 Tax=Chitinophaga lutea TaxID=2488634 RepID=A0A3N4Q3X7_9BACT|nr:helix-turn-helix domain-containing protein [Chitinophaga lutea]RPE12171.1 AraC family transcriptional regulator [Chitinophaga lutea]